jgi:hypothetical protein
MIEHGFYITMDTYPIAALLIQFEPLLYFLNHVTTSANQTVPNIKYNADPILDTFDDQMVVSWG